jgi:hypothetical protein
MTPDDTMDVLTGLGVLLALMLAVAASYRGLKLRWMI